MIITSNAINKITSQVQTYLKNSFEYHYYLSNQFHTKTPNAHCTGLTEDIYTHIFDVCDREWQLVGHEKQFEDIKKHLFCTFIKLFHQDHLELVEIISFFFWCTYTRDSVGKQTRMLNQP